MKNHIALLHEERVEVLKLLGKANSVNPSDTNGVDPEGRHLAHLGERLKLVDLAINEWEEAAKRVL